MAFSDVLQTLGRFIGLYSDTEASYEEAEYDEYPQQEAYEPAPEEQQSYQSGYGTGDSYVRAGARLRPPAARRPQEESSSPIQNLFGRPKQQPRQQYQPMPDNVIRMPSRDMGEPEYGVGIQPHPQAQQLQSSTIIFCVRRKDDSSQIINYLLTGINVILNFEEVDDAQCQRVLDMVSGAAFALRGTVARISHKNYLVAPTGVEIVRGEMQSEAGQGRERPERSYMAR